MQHIDVGEQGPQVGQPTQPSGVLGTQSGGVQAECLELGDQMRLVGADESHSVVEGVVVGHFGRQQQQLFGATGPQPFDQPQHFDSFLRRGRLGHSILLP